MVRGGGEAAGCWGASPRHGCTREGWGTPSAAGSLRPGPGFRVVTEQPIRGVASSARGLLPANMAPRPAAHPETGGEAGTGCPCPSTSQCPGCWGLPEEAWPWERALPVGYPGASQLLASGSRRVLGGHRAFLQRCGCPWGAGGAPHPALWVHRSRRKLPRAWWGAAAPRGRGKTARISPPAGPFPAFAQRRDGERNNE